MVERGKAVQKGTARARKMAEHIERLAANVMTGGTAEHLSEAGSELMKAIDKTMEDMSIPEETKKHLMKAEKETLLAVKSFLDVAIREIERVESGGKKRPGEKLKKIDIK